MKIHYALSFLLFFGMNHTHCWWSWYTATAAAPFAAHSKPILNDEDLLEAKNNHTIRAAHIQNCKDTIKTCQQKLIECNESLIVINRYQVEQRSLIDAVPNACIQETSTECKKVNEKIQSLSDDLNKKMQEIRVFTQRLLAKIELTNKKLELLVTDQCGLEGKIHEYQTCMTGVTLKQE